MSAIRIRATLCLVGFAIFVYGSILITNRGKNILFLNLDDILAGPSFYTAKAESHLVQYIREELLYPPPSPEAKPLLNFPISKAREGQIGQPKLIDKFLGNLTGGFFIEAGASDGEVISNTLMLEVERGWSGLLIEPDPKMFQLLQGKKR